MIRLVKAATLQMKTQADTVFLPTNTRGGAVVEAYPAEAGEGQNTKHPLGRQNKNSNGGFKEQTAKYSSHNEPQVRLIGAEQKPGCFNDDLSESLEISHMF